MSRRPRLVVPGQPMHIVQRGNNKQATFFTEEDYCFYLDAVKKAREEYPVDVHAYVLMTNHVHLLLTPHDEVALCRFMQSVGRRYVRYVNGAYRRSGTLWEGRYKSALIDTDNYLLKCYLYIEMNPVRAGMVGKPNDYRWSSFHRNAMGASEEIINSHKNYIFLGKTDKERQEVYLLLFRNQLSIDDIKVIRRGTNNFTVIGDTPFSEEIERVLKRKIKVYSHGGDRKSDEFNCLSSTLTL